MKEPKIKYLGLRDWLELGQYMHDLSRVKTFKHFRKWTVNEINVGVNSYVYTNGKRFYSGRYRLDETLK